MDSTIPPVANLKIRYTVPEDDIFLKTHLSDEKSCAPFTFQSGKEAIEAIGRWLYFCRYQSSITGIMDDEICGIATLYVNPYRQIAHQAEMAILVAPAFRRRGIGLDMTNELFKLGKNRFKLECIHIQIHDDPGVLAFFKKLQFTEFGRQKKWVKEEKKYRGRQLLERTL